MKFNTKIALLTSMRSPHSAWHSRCTSMIAVQVPTVPPGHSSLRVCQPVLTLIDGLVRYSYIMALSFRQFLAINTTKRFVVRLDASLYDLFTRKNLASTTSIQLQFMLKNMHQVNLLRGYQDDEVVDKFEYTRERLNEMVLSDLRVICRNKKLPVSGTKAALVERIVL